MDEPPVIRCPASLRAAALRLLDAAATPHQQEGLARAIATLADADDAAWDGLFAAVDGRPAPHAALWVQLAPGKTAVVWPPPCATPAADSLFRAAAAFVDERGIALAQLHDCPSEGFSPARLAACGFDKLADLVYQFAELPAPARGNPSQLHFQAHAGDHPASLAQLVERTYAGTLDCPALDGVRAMSDVLAGYRAQGRHMPQHWYTIHARPPQGARAKRAARAASPDALGVLILADHPEAGNWELIYMGVVPEARGRRLGDEIVAFAQETAARGGAARLVLAVDAANAPALAMYRRTHFSEWDRRTVYARMARKKVGA
jgi:ribosomal protein S18 acetylase RimI-like enzyme